MIKDLTIWTGRFTATYQDELNEWLADDDGMDKIVITTDEIPESSEDAFWEDSGGLFSDKTVLVMDVAGERLKKDLRWNAADVQWLIKRYADMEAPVRLGLVYSGGSPSPNIEKAATDIRVRSIPWDHDEMSEWTHDWLKKHGVLLDPKSCDKLIDHVGYDVDLLVEIVIHITTVKQGRITMDDIKPIMGNMGKGIVADYMQDLTQAILNGDRAEARRFLTIMRDESEHYIFSLLNSRFRTIAAVVFDPDMDISIFVPNPRAHFYIKRDARISKGRALRVMSILDQTEDRLKGGGDGLSSADSLAIMVDSLTLICGGEPAPIRL